MLSQHAPTRKPSVNIWADRVHVTELRDPSFASKSIVKIARIALGKKGEVPMLSFDVRILDTARGTFVAMPSEKRGDEWHSIIEVNDELKSVIEERALAAWKADLLAADSDVDSDIPF